MVQRLFLCWLIALGSCALSGQTAEQALTRFVDDPALRGALIGVHVVEAGSGTTVLSHQPDLALIPASTQKLLTTAVALDVLGPDHRFVTRLLAVGEVRDGTLHGNLYLVGGGDPSLGSPYLDGVPRLQALLDRWREAVGRAGIRHVTGRIIGDGSYFGTDGAASEWPWSDLGNYYGAGAYGLNLHENFYFLDLIQRSRVGSRPVIRGARPRVPGLNIENEARVGPKGSGDQAYIYGAPYGGEYHLRGTIPPGSGTFTIKGSIPDPALFAAQQLEAELTENGITLQLPAETHRHLGGGALLDGTVLDEYYSPPLRTLIERTNLRSNNLYAEALLREINKHRAGQVQTLSSTENVVQWLRDRALDVENVQLLDGSGLATRNFFSPRFMTSFLRTQAGNDAFVQTIPLSGRSGSMRSFLRGRNAAGRVYAKSGSLNAARCYAGYVDHPDGRRLAFAIMVNNYTLNSRALRGKMLVLIESLLR